MTALTFFRLSLLLPLVIPRGDIPPTISGAMMHTALEYSTLGYALAIPWLWWYLGRCQRMRDFRRMVLLAPAAGGALLIAAGGPLFALGCGFGLWGRAMVLCSEPSTIFWLAVALTLIIVIYAYLCALLIVVASILAVWLRIVKPPAEA